MAAEAEAGSTDAAVWCVRHAGIHGAGGTEGIHVDPISSETDSHGIAAEVGDAV